MSQRRVRAPSAVASTRRVSAIAILPPEVSQDFKSNAGHTPPHDYFATQQMELSVNMIPECYAPHEFTDGMVLESMPTGPWTGAPFEFPIDDYTYNGSIGLERSASEDHGSVDQCISSGVSGRSSLPPAEAKKVKEQERQERRRAQNRAAQRQFRQRRQMCIKENSARLETLEGEVTTLTSDNGGLASTISKLKGQIASLQRENRGLRRQSDTALESESDDESDGHARTNAEYEPDLTEEPLRWHWMKVQKARESAIEIDAWEVPSKFD